MAPQVEEIDGGRLVREMKQAMEKMLQKKVDAISVSTAFPGS